MALPTPRLFDPLEDKGLILQIAQIHSECILNDDQMLTFLPPLDHMKLVDYWLKVSERAEKGEVAIIVQLADDSSGADVVGVVYLAMPSSETGPFRSEVRSLMVSPRFRRQGIMRRLMDRIELLARDKERHLIMLDTAVGTAADSIYPKLGYREIGVIPKYGFSPKDGRLVDERFYYKDLRDE